jgi:hypothetical protein
MCGYFLFLMRASGNKKLQQQTFLMFGGLFFGNYIRVVADGNFDFFLRRE